MTSRLVWLVITLNLLITSPALASGTADRLNDRYFLMGSGVLILENLRNQRQAKVELLDAEGRINDQALAQADHVFGFPTAEKKEHFSPRLLFMLSYFADQVAPGKKIMIESAYRSPEYNDSIRQQGANAARTSTHIDGMALDFWIEGVDGKMLWETIRAKNCCGVGHYGDKTIHLDAGRPRFWEAATSGTKDPEPDHNRHIYLSPLYDRYLAGEAVALSLSGISVFNFGIRPQIRLNTTSTVPTVVAELSLTGSEHTACLKIDSRAATRFLSVALPADMPAGRYSLQMDFCAKPFSRMPDQIMSQPIEVIR